MSLPTRDTPLLLSATVDFPDDVRYGPYDLALLEEMMSRLSEMGVGRVYWLYYGDVDPASYWAGNIFERMQYGTQTLENIGEPVRAAVPVAHRYGLELYGVLKPYNTGLSGTNPEGSPGSDATGITRIGRTLMQVIPFVERHPETRIRRRPLRRPPRLESALIRKVRLLKKDDTPTRIRKENLQIWTSEDNHRYERRNVDFILTDQVEPAPREVRDYYGDLVTREGDSVRTLSLEGLNLSDRYSLITTDFHGRNGDFLNTSVAMVEAYGEGPEPLPIVVATRSAIWDRPRDFRTGGLEFDSGLGSALIALDVDNAATEGTMFGLVKKSKWHWGGCVALARGKNECLPCAPCEVFPEVRKLWRGWVGRLIEAGVDGIDLRVSAHSSLTDEPYAYGFNEMIRESYRQRYHQDLLEDEEWQPRLAELRGAAYTDFVRETSQRVRRAGKKVQAHVHAEAFRADPCPGQLMGFPANVAFDWQRWLQEGLLDGVTLRTSWFEALEAERGCLAQVLSDPVVEAVLQGASSLGVPVHLNRYLKRAASMGEFTSDLERIYRDERFAGFDVYEFAHVARPAPDAAGLESVKDRIDRIRSKAKALGIC